MIMPFILDKTGPHRLKKVTYEQAVTAWRMKHGLLTAPNPAWSARIEKIQSIIFGSQKPEEYDLFEYVASGQRESWQNRI